MSIFSSKYRLYKCGFSATCSLSSPEPIYPLSFPEPLNLLVLFIPMRASTICLGKSPRLHSSASTSVTGLPLPSPSARVSVRWHTSTPRLHFPHSPYSSLLHCFGDSHCDCEPFPSTPVTPATSATPSTPFAPLLARCAAGAADREPPRSDSNTAGTWQPFPLDTLAGLRRNLTDTEKKKLSKTTMCAPAPCVLCALYQLL